MEISKAGEHGDQSLGSTAGDGIEEGILNGHIQLENGVQGSQSEEILPQEILNGTKCDKTSNEIGCGRRYKENIISNDYSSNTNIIMQENGKNSSTIKIGELQIMGPPHSELPIPEAPPGVLINSNSPPPLLSSGNYHRSHSLPEKQQLSDIGKFIRDKGNSFSAAIAKRLSSSLRLDHQEDEDDDSSSDLHSNNNNNNNNNNNVTEFNLSGLRVVVKLKPQEEHLIIKGRISIFTRSNCRDCGAVRSFFRERGLSFVEINIDVYPMREKELIERSGGSSSVPLIFFNEHLFGGLVALNSLRNNSSTGNGMLLLDERLKQMLGKKCPDHAPAPPVYGFDDPDDDDDQQRTDDMIGIVRVLRQRLPIQDRLMKMKMKIVKNCFAGSEMVEVIIHHLDCGRKKAIDVGKQLAKKHFIHHVFGENEFEDGNHFYRFLEHEPFIPKCFNFRGSINDSEPKPAAIISQRLITLISAILESYASEDRHHVNYKGISNSEEFRRYVNLAQELQRVNIVALSEDEKLAFFLNLHNAMVIHAVIRVGHPGGVIDRRSFYSDFQYLVGGHPYSLSTIKNGILRSNRRPPYSLVKPFGATDKRLELACSKLNPLIHFGVCNGTRSSPRLRFYSPQGVESELRRAAREFFQEEGGMEVDLANRTVYLTRIIKWFDADFGQEKEILKWIINYLDATKAGLLTHLLGDGGPINIVYHNYDWSVNS